MNRGMTPITAEQKSEGAVGKRLEELGRALRFGREKNTPGNAPRLRVAWLLILLFLCAGPLTATAQGQLYALDSSRALYVLDMNTGARTLVATVSANAGTAAGLCYNPANNIVYLTSTSNDSLYSVDLATGTATLIGLYGDAAIVMHGLEFDDSTGTLYGVSSHNNGLYTINPMTGAATLVGTSGLASFTNLGYNSITNQMFATNSGTDSFYAMNRATGATTLIGPLNGPTNPNGVAFNRDNGLMYLVDNSTDNLYTIDLATGVATVIGPTGAGNFLGLAYVPVPEPAAVMLLGLGAAFLAARRLRSRGSRR